MTCDWCDGAGQMPCVDVWKMGQAAVNNVTLQAIPLMEAPCPNCKEDEFRQFLEAKVDRHGQPFDDEEITGAKLMGTPDGSRAVCPVGPTADEDEEED